MRFYMPTNTQIYMRKVEKVFAFLSSSLSLSLLPSLYDGLPIDLKQTQLLCCAVVLPLLLIEALGSLGPVTL